MVRTLLADLEGQDGKSGIDMMPGPGLITERMPVPKAAVGSVIGKHGESIKSICRESGARVVFADGNEEHDKRNEIEGNSFFFFFEQRMTQRPSAF